MMNPEHPGENLNQHTVLIVDDEEDMRIALHHVFHKAGYKVLLAENGQEAYAISLMHQISAIISDIRMPVMNGIDLLKKVKTRMPELPVVFLITGFDDISEADAKGLGVAGLVEKPFNSKKILAEVERAIREALDGSTATQP